MRLSASDRFPFFSLLCSPWKKHSGRNAAKCLEKGMATFRTEATAPAKPMTPERGERERKGGVGENEEGGKGGVG